MRGCLEGAGMVDDAVSPMDLREGKHPIQDRLEDQIGWYDRKSQNAQRRYKILKVAQVIIAGLIPLVSGPTELHCLSFDLRGAEARKAPPSGFCGTVCECGEPR
jgi:hypothetical protein